jgi:thymidylate synthase
MKLLVLRSAPAVPHETPGDDYSQQFDTLYAARVLSNLRNAPGFCTACGPDCIGCRGGYGRGFESDLVGVIDFPARLAHVLEKPEELLPAGIPAADAILAIAIHEQVLLEVVRRARGLGVRGIVVPLEAMDWISPAARDAATRLAEESGVEIAFPRPFCSFKPPEGSFLSEFRRHFRIGYPQVRLSVEDGVIREAQVEVSAACGATCCVARWLQGKRVEEDLKYDVIAKRLHSYPCTASMEWDEGTGDTVMHAAGHAHYDILRQLGIDPGRKPTTFVAPGGAVIYDEPRPQESAAKIKCAEAAILEALAERGKLTISELGRLRGVNPAAASTALILLKRDLRVRVEAGILRPGKGSNPGDIPD